MRVAISGFKVKDDEVTMVVQIGSEADILVTQTIKFKPKNLITDDIAMAAVPEIQKIVDVYKDKIKLYQDIEVIADSINAMLRW